METNRSVVPLRAPNPEVIRIPPYNPDAEMTLLGALLINNAGYHRVSEFLQPDHFGNALHGRIFAAISKLVERGQIANPVTLKNLFDQDATLTEVGGAQYLVRLAEAAVTVINAEDYGRTVYDLYLRRELITLGEMSSTMHFARTSTTRRTTRLNARKGGCSTSLRCDRQRVDFALSGQR